MLTIPDAIKALYLDDTSAEIRRNFRVHFPNGELPDINNDQIVQESVQMTESIMSQSTFKFGLAEAPQISFETVGVGNMLGMSIECSHEIETTSLSAADIAAIQAGTWDGELVLQQDSDLGFGFFRIPLGTFIVDSCPRNHGAMAHRRVTATAPTTVTNFGSAFSHEQWKMQHYYYNMSTMEIDLAKWIYATAGAELFGVSVSSSTSSFSSTVQTRELLSKSSGSGAQGGTLTLSLLVMNVNLPAGSVCSVDIPLIDSDFMDQYSAAWDDITSVFSEVDKDAFDAAIADVEQWGDSVTAWSRVDIDAFNISSLGTPSKAYYPLSHGNSGALMYSFENNNTGGTTIFVPVGVRLSRTPYNVPGHFAAKSTDIDLYTVPTYTVYTFAGTAPVYSAEPTASQKINSNTYYGYADSVNFSDVLSGSFELNGMFALNARAGAYMPIMLDDSSPISIVPGQYSEMWYDEYDVLPIGTVVYDYTDTDGKNQTITYNFGSGLSVYEMTGNFILQNIPHTMADAETMITDYMIPNLPSVDFTPAEIDAKGMPWLEAGDALAVETEDGEIVITYMLERTLSGIQSLRDGYAATGGELIAGAMGYGL